MDRNDAHANVARRNDELERRLADRPSQSETLAKDAVVVELQQTNAALTEHLKQRIIAGDQAAQKATRIECSLNEQLERHAEAQKHVTKKTLQTMDDVKWGFEELTRAEAEGAKTIQVEYEARLKMQIAERLENFDGAATQAHTLERNPSRVSNLFDDIWGETHS